MRAFLVPLFAFLGIASSPLHAADANPIDYDKVIHIDAEDLAEGGMVEAYDKITASITDERIEWAHMTQSDDGTPYYSVHVLGETFRVYGSMPGIDAWAVSSAVLFNAINRQLGDVEFKVYALGGGNDLHAVVSTEKQFKAAVSYHKRRFDRPYVPTHESPNFGYPE